MHVRYVYFTHAMHTCIYNSIHVCGSIVDIYILFYILNVYSCTTETVPIKEQLVMATVCEVNATPIYEGCISCNETVFLVELPKDLPSDTICYWNIPQSTTTYTHLLQHNIFGVPPGGCKNTLVTIDSEGEKRVSCGDLSFASKVLKLTNERSQGSSIDVFYHKTDNRQDDELSILFVRMGAKVRTLSIRIFLSIVLVYNICLQRSNKYGS